MNWYEYKQDSVVTVGRRPGYRFVTVTALVVGNEEMTLLSDR